MIRLGICNFIVADKLSFRVARVVSVPCKWSIVRRAKRLASLTFLFCRRSWGKICWNPELFASRSSLLNPTPLSWLAHPVPCRRWVVEWPACGDRDLLRLKREQRWNLDVFMILPWLVHLLPTWICFSFFLPSLCLPCGSLHVSTHWILRVFFFSFFFLIIIIKFVYLLYIYKISKITLGSSWF